MAESPITILLGARQTGKTTLARMAARQRDIVRFFDLEAAADRTALTATPEKILSEATGLVVLDEIQRVPSLFEVLRPLADRPDAPGLTRSLGIALTDLILDRAFVVYPGTMRYPLSDSVEVIPLSEIPKLKP